jgi:hypothetical protein
MTANTSAHNLQRLKGKVAFREDHVMMTHFANAANAANVGCLEATSTK